MFHTIRSIRTEIDLPFLFLFTCILLFFHSTYSFAQSDMGSEDEDSDLGLTQLPAGASSLSTSSPRKLSPSWQDLAQDELASSSSPYSYNFTSKDEMLFGPCCKGALFSSPNRTELHLALSLYMKDGGASVGSFSGVNQAISAPHSDFISGGQKIDFSAMALLSIPLEKHKNIAREAPLFLSRDGSSSTRSLLSVNDNTSSPPKDGREQKISVPELPPGFVDHYLRIVLSHAGLFGSQDRLNSMQTRARISGLLPTAMFRVLRSSDNLVGTNATSIDTRATDRLSQTLQLEGRLSFDLDRLIFASEEPHVERLQVAARREVLDRKSEALALLFEWQKRKLELGRVPEGSSERSSLQLLVFQTEAYLNMLTGDWFQSAKDKLPMLRLGKDGL